MKYAMYHKNISFSLGKEVGMNLNSFVTTKSLYPTIGCDLPQNGGIAGSPENDKPNPMATEERPTMVDPETGELVYVDVYEKQHPNPNVVFSTTA